MALVKPTGWTDTAQSLFDSAGQLAGGAMLYLSGRGKENRNAIKAEREAQAAAYQNAELAEQRKDTQKINLLSWITTNWLWLTIAGAVLLLIVLWKPIMRLFNIGTGNGNTRRSRRPSRVKVKIRTRSKSKSRSSGSSGFSRKIHGKVYRSRKAWSDEMQRLRGKK